MLPTPKNLSIYQSVVPLNKVSKMMIVPNERAFLLFEGQEYTVRIMAVDSDDNYYAPVSDTVVVTAKNGIIEFDYTFGKEQEYLIHLIYLEKVMHKFNVYALDEDLYELTPLRGDLHVFRPSGRNVRANRREAV